ncbi:MAG: hydrogenase maturation nickel metallochaperone HypA [Candidatus Omnitrophota bacterium]
MHDLRYANEILAALKNKNVSKGRAKDVTVNVRLSPFSHVRPEGLNETFRLLAGSEGYGNVKLDVKALEFEMHCRSCGRESRHAKAVFKCPYCDSADFDIQKNEEFYIDSIDINN